MSETDEIRKRVQGCLFGGALGDALGAPIEFMRSWQAIAAAHGSSAPSQLAYAHPAPAQITDDTQMTLFVAEGMIRAAQRYENRGMCDPAGVIRGALMRWYSTQVPNQELDYMASGGWLVNERRLHVRRAPGRTNVQALESVVKARLLERPAGSALAPNNSKGCGAVMRSAPIGLGYKRAKDAFDLARESAADTHGHPSGQLSAAYFAALIQRVTHGDTLAEAMRCADDLLVQEPGHEEVAAAVVTARTLASGGPLGPDAIEALGQGWVAEEALAIALACTLTAEGSSPEAVSAALWRSVLHGGNSDSTGSLAGNLLGAVHGMDCLPTRWLQQLELCDVIERISHDFFRSTHLGEALDMDEDVYPPH